ncbi:MAG: glycosyltransferase [Clostridiales bacterium]|nr:glycosyltransferase [Clostridiales bacterium]
MKPCASVIVPVYNTQQYLDECLQSLLGQSLQDIEVICINDSSTDDSLNILEKYANEDSRLKYFTVEHCGAGGARNRGIEVAQGDFLYFFDSDDVADKFLLEKAINRARVTGADIVAFNGYTFENDNLENTKFKSGFNLKAIGSEERVFSYRDFPVNIMSVVNVAPWNKLFRARFVKELPFRFDEISSTNDITFSALSVAAAQKIAVINESLMYYRVNHAGSISSGKTKNLDNVAFAVESTLKQAQTLGWFNEISTAVYRFAVSNYCFAFKNYCKDMRNESAGRFCQHVHKAFNTPPLDNLSANEVGPQYQAYNYIKTHSNFENAQLPDGRIIVSLTTYPARISTIHNVIENMCRQTKKADLILLWLAESDFENREADLPAELLEQQRHGKVEIRFCDNLFSHKKYYYTMKEYPNSIVITVDDDLVYPKRMIEWLYNSYMHFPNCVSAMRAHVITVNPYEKKILPYEYWLKEYRANNLMPSTQFFATSGAGTLYPPHLLNERLFDKETFMQICPSADDIWLNAMGLLNGVQTVLARPSLILQYLPGTQTDTLYSQNVVLGKNNKQFSAVRGWLTAELGSDIIYKNLTEIDSETGFLTYEQLLGHINNATVYYGKRVNRLTEINKEYENNFKSLKKQSAALEKMGEAHKNKISALKEKNAALKEKNSNLKNKNIKLKEKNAALEKYKAQESTPRQKTGVWHRLAGTKAGKMLRRFMKKVRKMLSH